MFAPTDDAFAKLPPSLVSSLRADPTGQLSTVLQYHVLEQEVPSSAVTNDLSVPTLAGPPIRVNVYKGGSVITVNGKRVIIPVRTTQHLNNNNIFILFQDVPASNGVVHVIDGVLVPPAGDIPAVLAADGRFSTLLAAVEAAGLVETLQGNY